MAIQLVTKLVVFLRLATLLELYCYTFCVSANYIVMDFTNQLGGGLPILNVRVRILFKLPTEEDRQTMRSLAASLTSDPKSVRVSADETPGWLVAEFTMPTEAQYKALPKIDRAIRLDAWNRLNSTIDFPFTEAERASADRKAARRKARRRAK